MLVTVELTNRTQVYVPSEDSNTDRIAKRQLLKGLYKPVAFLSNEVSNQIL